MRVLVTAVLLATVVCGCGRSSPSPGSSSTPIPPGAQRINGTERLGWNQEIWDPVELERLTFFVLLDGQRTLLTGVSCSVAGPASAACSSTLPPMTAGTHTIQVVASNGYLDSEPSTPPVTVFLTASTAPVPVSAAPGMPGSTPGIGQSTADGVRLEAVKLAAGLEDVSDVAATPDGRLFAAERAGRIRSYRDGALATGPAATLNDTVAAGGQLLAIAVDPSFDSNGWVYVVHTAAAGSSPSALEFLVSRFKAVGDTLSERVTLLANVPAPLARPAAALRFGPDGKMYAALDEGGDARAAGDMASFSGKVLRLNRDGSTPDDAKILITGESGVGKEVLARLIHRQSNRARAQLVTINCAGLPDSLLESELFGHVRGSFTGAYRDKPGLLETAHNGTIFMDEVGEMSLRMQALLLRFLESGEIQRVGAERAQARVNVRVIAATNRNLTDRIATKDFREDLYYRLNVIHLTVPALRDRRDDIPEMLEHFIGLYSHRHSLPLPKLAPEALQLLVAYNWPGNVRELRNFVERLVLRARSGLITPADLPLEIIPPPQVAVREPVRGAAIERMFDRMTNGRESFWTVVYEPFMSRDMTRDDLRALISRGLEQTRGSYRILVQMFNMPEADYKRFLNFLRKHDCQMPFQKFRNLPSRPENGELAEAPGSIDRRRADV